MKQIIIIPTIHTDELPIYNHEILFSFLTTIDPDVIFSETSIDMQNSENDLAGLEETQESKAIKKFQKFKDVREIPIDLPYRNSTAFHMDLFEIEKIKSSAFGLNESTERELRFIGNSIESLWNKNDLEFRKHGVQYLFTRRRTKLVKRIRFDLEYKYVSRYDSLNGTNFLLKKKASDHFHFVTREFAMAWNAFIKMECFNVGVILVGADHFDLYRKMRMISDGNIKICYFNGKMRG